VFKCKKCGKEINQKICPFCKTINENYVDVTELGYASAREVLGKTVIRGKDYEKYIIELLKKMNYIKDVDYQYQKNVKYSDINRYAQIREDFIFPNQNFKTILSVTHSHPTIPGHSNENKLHQALGELWLFKTYNLNTKCIIFMGGEKEKWLEYVIDTMDIF
jgi:hypothetical protein